jgi:hypothetical protein
VAQRQERRCKREWCDRLGTDRHQRARIKLALFTSQVLFQLDGSGNKASGPRYLGASLQ